MQLPLCQTIPEQLLGMALTHSSYTSEHPGLPDNERLEFLGDAVVGLAYADHLYRTYPEKTEGELALILSGAVRATTLAERAKALNLGSYLRLGKGEDLEGGRERESVLAGLFEAVVGAIYLGCGWESARSFVIDQLTRAAGRSEKDHKTRLQELLQAWSQQLPEYRVVQASGPDHAKTFVVEVWHRGELLGRGSGRSKKEAQQQAAGAALARLGRDE